ncbi:hypothetical protein [Rhizomonospora bruguierae]|uniref:hypothetical protein n=1 Tax=Rhizomonospora bruguierae TaxID=1581705 RepID=UPI001BCD5B3C|nr:hypothetical protein [Micromonospora sp. NBRC 107566]
METEGPGNETGRPDPAAAQEALTLADRSAATTRQAAPPRWQIPVSAALVAAAVPLSMLGHRAIWFLVAVVIGLLAVHLLAARQAGVIGSAGTAGPLTAIVPGVLVAAAAIVLHRLTGHLWIVPVGAVVAAAVVLVAGALRRRSPV